MGVLLQQSPAWDQDSQIKRRSWGVGFWVLLLGRWLIPGWAETRLFARLCNLFLLPAVYACASGEGVCVCKGDCLDGFCSVLAELGSFPPLLSPVCPLWYMCEFPFLRLSEISFPLCRQETDFNCLYFLPFFFFFFVII